MKKKKKEKKLFSNLLYADMSKGPRQYWHQKAKKSRSYAVHDDKYLEVLIYAHPSKW